MLILEPGMQHKTSDTWKCAYNTEYPAMAEDAVADTTTNTMTGVSSPSNNSNTNNSRTSAPPSPLLTNGKVSPDSAQYFDRKSVMVKKELSEDVDLGRGAVGGRARDFSGLEQKIQELRAEKEACELRMSPHSDGNVQRHLDSRAADEDGEERETHQSQDTPLDFSVKRRGSSFSGSVTDESRASSSSPSHGTADYRGGSLLAVSPSPEPVSLVDTARRSEDDLKDFYKVSQGHIVGQQFHHHLHPNYVNHRSEGTPSPESHKIKLERDVEMVGESEVHIKSELDRQDHLQYENSKNNHTHIQKQAQLPGLNPSDASSLPAPLLNTIGGLFPGLNPNFLAGKSAIGAFSQMAAAAAYIDPRLNVNTSSSTGTNNNSSSTNTKKTTRPFKAYPKEALQMPLGGFFGAPGLSPSLLQQGIESGMFTGMNTEDLMALYNQQLQLLRDKQVSSSTPTPPQGRKGNLSPSSSPNGTSGNGSRHQNNHHENHILSHEQEQHSKYRNHQQAHGHSPPHHLTTTNSHHPYMSVNPSSNNILTSHHHQNNSSSPPGEHTSRLHTNTSSGNNFSAAASTLVSSTSPSPSPAPSQNGGSNSRKRPRSLPDEQKDAAYWERRRKNNDAAKRSRDARRAKEDEIALRAALLEQENIKLRVEVASLKTETSRLRCLLYNS